MGGGVVRVGEQSTVTSRYNVTHAQHTHSGQARTHDVTAVCAGAAIFALFDGGIRIASWWVGCVATTENLFRVTGVHYEKQ